MDGLLALGPKMDLWVTDGMLAGIRWKNTHFMLHHETPIAKRQKEISCVCNQTVHYFSGGAVFPVSPTSLGEPLGKMGSVFLLYRATTKLNHNMLEFLSLRSA